MKLFKTTIIFMTILGLSACGDNPEKKRILLDSSANYMSSFSTLPYQSASGKVLQIDPKTKAVRYQAQGKPHMVRVRYYPEEKKLSLRGAINSNVYSNEVSDQFEKLDQLWKDYKNSEAAVGPALPKPFTDSETFEVTCSQERSGAIEAIYERPENQKIKLKDYEVAHFFASHPSAKAVARFKVSEDTKKNSYNVEGDRESVLYPYFSEEKVIDSFSKNCLALNELNDQFRPFIKLTGYYDSSGTQSVPIYELSPKLLRFVEIDAHLFNKHHNSLIFSNQPYSINMKPHLKSVLKQKYQSGRLSYAGEDYVAQFDEKEIRVDMNLETDTFTIRKNGGVSDCGYDIRGKIKAVELPTKAYHNLSDAIRVEVEVEHYDSSHCTHPSSLKKGETLLVYVAAGQYNSTNNQIGREISLIILDNKTKQEIVYKQTFVTR